MENKERIIQGKDIQCAIDSDFRRACEILGYDPEEAQDNPDLFAEVAFYLMTTEVI